MYEATQNINWYETKNFQEDKYILIPQKIFAVIEVDNLAVQQFHLLGDLDFLIQHRTVQTQILDAYFKHNHRYDLCHDLNSING